MQLQAKEDSAEDIATIPTLSRSDLDRDVEEYPLAVTSDFDGTGITVAASNMPSTSGVVYATLGVDVSGVPLDDAPLLPLFCRIMMETGAGEYDDVQLSR